jgi:arginase
MHHAFEPQSLGDERVKLTFVEPIEAWHAEISTSFDIARVLANATRRSVAAREFPMAVAGNCSVAMGMVAGVRAGEDDDVGVIWLDSHADFNTPETSHGGFLDGMSLAAVTGRCFTTLATTIPGFVPVREERVLLVGGHDLDRSEAAILGASRIAHVTPSDLRASNADATLERALQQLTLAGVRRVYLHVDLDVHDIKFGRANSYSLSGGLSPEDVAEIIQLVASRFAIASASLTAYDPAADPEQRARMLACRVIAELIAANAKRGLM